MLNQGVGGANFSDIAHSLTQGSYGSADAYMTLADFDSYKNAHNEILSAYGDRDRFNRMSLVNIANAGVFSADRSVRAYLSLIHI